MTRSIDVAILNHPMGHSKVRKSMTRSIDVAILNNSMGHSKVREIVDALNKSSNSQPLNRTQQGQKNPWRAQ